MMDSIYYLLWNLCEKQVVAKAQAYRPVSKSSSLGLGLGSSQTRSTFRPPISWKGGACAQPRLLFLSLRAKTVLHGVVAPCYEHLVITAPRNTVWAFGLTFSLNNPCRNLRKNIQSCLLLGAQIQIQFFFSWLKYGVM